MQAGISMETKSCSAEKWQNHAVNAASVNLLTGHTEKTSWRQSCAAAIAFNHG